MPKLTSVASTQNKYRRDQGRVVGEQSSEKIAKLSEIVENGRFCVHYSFQRVFVRERAFVFRTHQCRTHIATHTHTHHAHTNCARTTKFRNHENPKKMRKLLRVIAVVRIPMVFVREQGWCSRASIWATVSTSHPRGNPG